MRSIGWPVSCSMCVVASPISTYASRRKVSVTGAAVGKRSVMVPGRLRRGMRWRRSQLRAERSAHPGGVMWCFRCGRAWVGCTRTCIVYRGRRPSRSDLSRRHSALWTTLNIEADVALPQLTDEQRAAALEKAAAARRARAQLKERLKRGGTTLKQVLADAENDEAVAKLKVSALLESLPGVGRVRAAALMEQFEIAPGRRVRGLGERQRQALLNEFGY